MHSAAHITPQGLRSGDPDALVALCDRRGAAVFAYCERAAGSEDAVAVAAEAFAQFRRAIMPAGALSGKDHAETPAWEPDRLRYRLLHSPGGSPATPARRSGPLTRLALQRHQQLLIHTMSSLR